MIDFSKPRLRLFVAEDLAEGASMPLNADQSHYLANVMRAKIGEEVWLFNGRDGQWLARLDQITKRNVTVMVERRDRPQAPEPDVWLLSAPIKRERLDLITEKATEMGVSHLWPVMTQHTVNHRLNLDKMQAHLREAAEQCERLTIPELHPPAALAQALEGWDPARPVIYLDEHGADPIAAVVAAIPKGTPLAVLIGPEGGFSQAERTWLRGLPMVRPVSMGPRILRAETAVCAALAVIQALHEI